MSGGSMNYICFKIEDAAKDVPDREIRDLMNDLAELMKSLEWWTSGDTNRDYYDKNLQKFKKKWFKDSRNIRLKKYIDDSVNILKEELYGLVEDK